MIEKTELHNAIEVLKKHLTNDSGYRDCWRTNLASAYKDEMEAYVGGTTSETYRVEPAPWAPCTIYKVGNAAADRFLDSFLRNVYVFSTSY